MADQVPEWARAPSSASSVPAWAASPPAAPTQPKDKGAGTVLDMIMAVGGPEARAGVALGEAGLNMATGMVAKPVSEVMGMSAMVKDILGGSKPEDQDAAGFKNSVREGLTYEPRTPGGQAVAQYNPLALIGKGVDAVGKGAEGVIAPKGSGTGREMVGAGVHEAINQAPQFLGLKAPPIVRTAGESLKDTARNTMQSAMKPPLADLKTGKAGKAIDTLLDEGLNVTPGGAAKIRAKIDDLNTQIADQIKNSKAVIDKRSVANRLGQVFDDFEKQVNATDDLKAIQKAKDDFMDHPLLYGKNKMSVQDAQAMKQGTYKSLKDKAYGELKGADIEAQKALARGLKEKIADAVPQVRELNAEESRYLNALPLVERRVLMDANKNPFGLGWLTTNPAKFAGWMADRSPLFKSLVARMLNQSSKLTMSIAPVAPAAGAAMTQGANLANIPQPPDNQ